MSIVQATRTTDMLDRSASLLEALSAWFVRMSTKNLDQALMARFGAKGHLPALRDMQRVAGVWIA